MYVCMCVCVCVCLCVCMYVWLDGFSKRLSTAISTVWFSTPPPPNYQYAVPSSYKTRNCLNIRNIFDILDNRRLRKQPACLVFNSDRK